MGRRSDLTTEQIAQATSLLRFSHLSQRQICSKLNLSKGSVSKIATSLKNANPISVHRKGNCGSKRKTDERTDRIIVKTAMQHCNKPIKTIKNILSEVNINLSTRTIRRRLSEQGIKTYKAAKKPKLNKIQMKKRLAWARKHENWSVDQWKKVVLLKI